MNENMEVKSKDYFNEEISKDTGLDKHFLKQIRVYVKDGRVFEGRFEALDSSMGIVLSNVVEYYHYDCDSLKKWHRSCSHIVIPGDVIDKCLVVSD